jgi:hypothetical protein
MATNTTIRHKNFFHRRCRLPLFLFASFRVSCGYSRPLLGAMDVER